MGAGALIETRGSDYEIACPLHEDQTVFQAEVFAVLFATDLLLRLDDADIGDQVHIHVDSRAALLALNGQVAGP